MLNEYFYQSFWVTFRQYLTHLLTYIAECVLDPYSVYWDWPIHRCFELIYMYGRKRIFHIYKCMYTFNVIKVCSLTHFGTVTWHWCVWWSDPPLSCSLHSSPSLSLSLSLSLYIYIYSYMYNLSLYSWMTRYAENGQDFYSTDSRWLCVWVMEF